MADEMGYPFQGSVYYGEESAYAEGEATTLASTLFRFSDAVQVCRLESGDINRTLKHVGLATVADFSKTLVDPRLHLEFIWQPHDNSSISDFVNRTNGDINSYCVEFGASEDRTNSSYYKCEGCKCDSLNISASSGENYMITLDFSVASVVTDTSATGSDPGAYGTDYAAFNRAGSINWTGTSESYYVTNSLDVTINNNLNDYWDVGSTAKQCAIPGAKDVTGSVDISMDKGGAIHWGDVTSGIDITSIKIDSACSGSAYDVFTIDNARFDSTSIENNVSGEGMFDSVPFTAKDITFTTS